MVCPVSHLRLVSALVRGSGAVLVQLQLWEDTAGARREAVFPLFLLSPSCERCHRMLFVVVRYIYHIDAAILPSLNLCTCAFFLSLCSLAPFTTQTHFLSLELPHTALVAFCEAVS